MPEPQLTYFHLGEGITAFCTTRHGGYSCGSYGEFNINHYCGDTQEAIQKNRGLLCDKLGITDDHLLMPHQVHGTGICQITPGFLSASADRQAAGLEGMDAVMTDVPGVCIGVSTADCIPIILYDPIHRAVCTVHAGWRGTVQRIAREALQVMIGAYGSEPAQLQAVIGPGISLAAFEVGDEVYDAFAAAHFPMETIARQMMAMDGTPVEKWHIDLWACNRLQLEALDVQPENIHVSGICTWQHCDDYFSARRLGINSGRILTAAIIHYPLQPQLQELRERR